MVLDANVFERFFASFGKQVSDYYQLERLNPGYQVVFGKDEVFPVHDSIEKIADRFELEEKGSGRKLVSFLNQAKRNYDVAIEDLVYKPGVSPLELITPVTIKNAGLFLTNVRKQVERDFKSPKLRSILQFPVLFLGAKPEQTPAFYNFMNYADFGLGTWHPKGGMIQIVNAMVSLAKELGVFHTDAPVMKSSQITKKQLEFVWEIPYTRQISSSVVQTIIIPKVCYKHLFADTARPIGRKKYLLRPLFCFIWGSIKNWIIWRITISFLM